VKFHMQGTVRPLLAFGAVIILMATLVPGSWHHGGEVKSLQWLADLGWRGAVCMLPLLLLAKNTIASISR